MRENKYSTRLNLNSSIDIVNKYAHRYKKHSLPPIIDALEKCIQTYSTYEWTHNKYTAFRKEEQEQINRNEQTIHPQRIFSFRF